MKELDKFWQIVTDVWQNGVYGINIGKIITALFIFFLFLLFRRLLSKFIINRLKSLAQLTKNELDDQIISSLEKPIRFIPIVLGIFFAFEYLDLQGGVSELGSSLIRSMVVINIFWALVSLIDPLSFILKNLEKIFTSMMVDWLLKIIKWALYLLCGATVLEIWGIKVGPIIAGFGLFGVAVALGAQDMFKNLIAGLLIIAEKRFMSGDWIRVDGVVEGTVEQIGFRSTLVRRFDKAPVYVPNSKLSDSAVTNFSEMTHRRIYWKIGVVYNTNVEQLKQIRDGIENYVLNTPEFAKPPEVSTFVRIDSFNDSSIDIMLYCFTKTTVWGEWLEIKEQLAYKIKNIIEEAGSSFAFPSQSVYLESIPSERPEIFVPPKD